jgi:hypothetical protein
VPTLAVNFDTLVLVPTLESGRITRVHNRVKAHNTVSPGVYALPPYATTVVVKTEFVNTATPYANVKFRLAGVLADGSSRLLLDEKQVSRESGATAGVSQDTEHGAVHTRSIPPGVKSVELHFVDHDLATGTGDGATLWLSAG